MSTRSLFQKTFFLAAFLALLLSFGHLCYAMVGDNGSVKIKTSNLKQGQNPKYAPGQIIIKFKDEPAVTNQLSTLDSTLMQSKGAMTNQSINTLSNILPNLKVKKMKKVFNDKPIDTQVIQNDLNMLSAQKVLDPTSKIKEKKLKKQLLSEEKKKQYGFDRVYLIETEDQNIFPIIENLKKDPNIEYAEPNYIMELCRTPIPDTLYIPNDYYIEDSNNIGYFREGSWGQPYPDMWGIQKTQTIEAHNIFDINHNGIFDNGEKKPGEGVVVAVIDTGVDYNHEDLAQNMWINEDEIPDNGIDDDGNGYIDDVRGYDISDEDNNPLDYFGHGTHVSGTIAAIGNNEIGVIGIAPYAKIMPVKIFPNAYEDVCAEGILYAADNGAKVLSNSWGGEGISQLFTDAFHYAYDLGCVSVAAAGNSDMDMAYFTPANIDTVIAVAASTQNDEKCSFSNWGDKIDVSAPGGGYENESGGGRDDLYNILSTMPDDCNIAAMSPNLKIADGYYRLAGTSMAAPHVSGALALLISMHPEFTNEDLRRAIKMSSDDIGDKGWDPVSGSGRINVFKTLGNFSSPPPEIKAAITSPQCDSTIPYDNRVIQITGTALSPGFKNYLVEYAFVTTRIYPLEWKLVYEGRSLCCNNLLAAWDTSSLPAGYYFVRLTVNDAIYNEVATTTIMLAPKPLSMNGWPKEYAGFLGAPVSDDINEDGFKETVVFGFNQEEKGIFMFDHLGNLIGNGILQSGSDAQEWHTGQLMIGDVTSDEIKEIVYPFSTYSYDSNVWTTKLALFNNSGNLIKTLCGLGGTYYYDSVLSDSNGDGAKEIFINNGTNPASFSGPNVLMSFDVNGPLQDWPEIRGFGWAPFGSADIDKDGSKEVVTLWGEFNDVSSSIEYGIYAWDEYGDVVTGFPFLLPHEENKYYSTLGDGNFLTGDIDNDGSYEFITNTTQHERENDRHLYNGVDCVIIVDSDGDIKEGWPQLFPDIRIREIVIGDINRGDTNHLEIVMLGKQILYKTGNDWGGTEAYKGSTIYVWNDEGALLPGWPKVSPSSYYMLVLADVNGDRNIDIIAGGDNEIMAWDKNGQELTGFPIKVNGTVGDLSILDFDKDGMLELLVKCYRYGKIKEIDLIDLKDSSFYYNAIEWPMYRHDPQRTGCYTSMNKPPVLAPIGNKEIQIGHYLLFPASATDPDGDKIHYGVTNLPDGARFIPMSEPLYKWMKRQYPNLTYPCNLFYWQPKGNQVGSYKVTFWVEDIDQNTGKPKSRTQEEVTITVKRPPNKPPWIQFVQNYRNTTLRWRGYDLEDKFNLEYSYRIDKGAWSEWAKTDSIAIKLISKGLKKGNHALYVRARDSQRCESEPKSASFSVR